MLNYLGYRGCYDQDIWFPYLRMRDIWLMINIVCSFLVQIYRYRCAALRRADADADADADAMRCDAATAALRCALYDP